MKIPKKCIVDTNVPKTANLATKPDKNSETPDVCILSCVNAIENIINKKSVIVDNSDEIFEEYRHQLSLKGQPGVGDKFMKWVNDHRWSLPKIQRVTITKNGDSYREFPIHPSLNNFDPSDRKFVAVANAHPDKPPIIEATDSKWWGWKQPLKEVGINVRFLCPEYIENKYSKKIGC